MIYKTKYLDPMVGFAFRKIFTGDANRDLLIAFLNEVLNERRHIFDVSYMDMEHIEGMMEEEEVMIDLLCIDEKGDSFYMQVQTGRKDDFEDRALYHGLRLMEMQLKDSTPGHEVKDVYIISLLRDHDQIGSSDNYRHSLYQHSLRGGKTDGEVLGLVFIEMPLFVKTANELKTGFDKWLFVLKNMGSMDNIPANLHHPIFEKLFSLAEYSGLTDEEKGAYDRSCQYQAHNKGDEADTAKEQRMTGGRYRVLLNRMVGLPDDYTEESEGNFDVIKITITPIKKDTEEKG